MNNRATFAKVLKRGQIKRGRIGKAVRACTNQIMSTGNGVIRVHELARCNRAR